MPHRSGWRGMGRLSGGSVVDRGEGSRATMQAGGYQDMVSTSDTCLCRELWELGLSDREDRKRGLGGSLKCLKDLPVGERVSLLGAAPGRTRQKPSEGTWIPEQD